MGLIEGLRAMMGERRTTGAVGGNYSPTEVGWGRGIGWSLLGTRYGNNRKTSEVERLQSNVGFVRVAVMKKADDLSALKCVVQTRKSLDNEKWEPSSSHPLQALIDRPTPFMSGMELRHLMAQHLDLLGRCALLVVEGLDGKPLELHVLMPHLLIPIRDRLNYISGWNYTTNGENMAFEVYDPNKRSTSGMSVIYTRVPNAQDFYEGDSTVQAAQQAIDLDGEIRRYAWYYYHSNAAPGVVLESDQPQPDPLKRKEYRENWEERHEGVQNAGKLAVLWGGLKYRSVSPDFSKLDIPNTAKATRTDILAFFGVPQQVIGISESGALGGDSTAAAFKIYQKGPLNIHRLRIMHALDQLAPRYGKKLRVYIESPIEEDVLAIAELRKWQYTNGVLGRTEYRFLEGFTDDGEPEVYVLPRNSMVLHNFDQELIAMHIDQGGGEKAAKGVNGNSKESLTAPLSEATKPAGKDAALSLLFALERDEMMYAETSGSVGRVVQDLSARVMLTMPSIGERANELRSEALKSFSSIEEAYDYLETKGARRLGRILRRGGEAR